MRASFAAGPRGSGGSGAAGGVVRAEPPARTVSEVAGTWIAAEPSERGAAGTVPEAAGVSRGRSACAGVPGGLLAPPSGGGGGGGAERTGAAAGVGVLAGTGVVAGREGTGPPGPVGAPGRGDAVAAAGPETAGADGTGLRNGCPPPGMVRFGGAAGSPSTVAARGAAAPAAGTAAVPTGRSEADERVAGGRTCPDPVPGDAGAAGSPGAPLCGGFPPSRG